MDNETKIAKEFVKDVRALAKKYRKQKHLRDFLADLDRVAGVAACFIEDTKDVE